jgi:hypothetical protein
MTAAMPRLRHLASALLAVTVLAGCADQNLWNRDFSKATSVSKAAAASSNVTGYWEGPVAMGGVRARIEPARITLALKCDKDGKILSQGSAPIVFKSDDPARMTLLEDLSSGPDEKCGFRFYKGNEFRYRLDDNGMLELDFAGSSVSRMQKLGD